MLFRIGNLIKTRIFLDHCNFISLNCKKCYADVVTNKAGPLDGIRVLDLSRIIAGPFCTMILGDLGAEIIKIERPQIGDESRNWGPPFIKGTKESYYFLAVNRNKKSVCVDLKSPKGQKVIHDLAAKCDVLVENYVPGKLNEFNLDYDTIKHVAPKLIYCSITGYGSEGPYSKRPGYDVIAASVGGLMHITGPRGGEPCKVGVPMTDMATGLYAHGAIIAALFQRGRTGLGQKIDCDLLSTQVSCLINVAANNLNVGLEAERWGTSHSSIVPYESFPTSDGCYITIGAGSNQQFKELCEKLDLPHLVVDERFCNNEMRVKNRKILIETLRNRFKEKSLEEWCALLQDSSFPNGPINSISKDVPTLRLRLRKPKPKKKVQWRSGTVDNEHLNKKKSKCCCQYEKPRQFGESSSDSDDDECENCHGHVERKRKKKQDNGSSCPLEDKDGACSPPNEPSTSNSHQ